MSNISAPGGLKVPSFQAAQNKGNDSGGNGGGGMFFGDEEQPYEEQNPYYYDPFHEVGLQDMVYQKPLPAGAAKSSALESWKQALATRLYEGLHQELLKAEQAAKEN